MSLLKRNDRRRNSYTSVRRSAVNSKNSAVNRNRRSTESRKKPAKASSWFSLPTIHLSAQGLRRSAAWICGLMLVGGLLAGVTLGAIELYQFCMTSESFAVSNIKVLSNSQVKREDILAVCHLEEGMNSLTVDIRAAEQALLKNPWIESVSIRRQLPSTVVIEIQERTPRFFATKNGSLYYITEKGEIIAPVTAKNFRSLPVLEIGPGGEDSMPLVSEFLEEFSQAGFPFDISQISKVRISAGSGFELYWENKKLLLSIGTEHWKDNLKRIATVVTDMEKRKETVTITSIRAADGQVWLTKNTTEPTETAM